MPLRPTTLIYGRDAPLIQTRQWVLERVDFQVLTALRLTEVKDIIGSKRIDLFILCHSPLNGGV